MILIDRVSAGSTRPPKFLRIPSALSSHDAALPRWLNRIREHSAPDSARGAEGVERPCCCVGDARSSAKETWVKRESEPVSNMKLNQLFSHTLFYPSSFFSSYSPPLRGRPLRQ